MTINIDRRQALQGAAAAGALGALGLTTAGSASAETSGLGTDTVSPARTTALTVTSTPVLKVGSSGTAVRDLQTKLSGAGYWLGTVDGSFGAMTLQAVHAIQKYHGLTRDGVCGPLTWSKVNLRRRPVARIGGERIEVDKARQLLLVSSGGIVQVALSTSTGSNKPFQTGGVWYNGQTPSGNFSCFRYIAGWYTNALGSLYRPIFFNGGIAIHGSTSIPPYNASHGCCRLNVKAQDLLFARGWLKIGRAVSVY